MARHTIKLFQFVKKEHQTLGVCPPQADGKVPFNLRNTFALFCFVQLAISVALFLILKAKTTQEYCAAFFMCSTQFYLISDLSILMWQMPNTLDLITDFEEFIEKSE